MSSNLLNYDLVDQALSQDVHICGGCKLQFNSVKSFVLHKTECCVPNDQQNEQISTSPASKTASNRINSSTSNVENVDIRKTQSAAFSSSTPSEETPTTTATNQNSNIKPSSNKRFHCEVESCQYKTCYLKDLLRHMRTHTGEKPFSCSICGKNFNRADKLKMHERWHTGAKPYKCKECDYATNDNSSLKKHLRVHSGERPFKCQICPYASRNSSQLVVHLRTHTGDSPFHCPVCNTKFKINSDLKRHLRMHTGEKPYMCQLCDYRCAIKGNLKTHMKLNHSTDNVQKCSHCEFTSSSRKAIREHEKTHDAKAVKCHQCPYTCTTRAALRNHQRIHSNERPFKCDYCSYASRQPGNVRTHIKKRHGDKLQRQKRSNKKASTEEAAAPEVKRPRSRPLCVKSFQCKFCEAAFVREDSLRSHLRQHNERLKQLEGTATIAVLQLATPVVSGTEEAPVQEQTSTQLVDFALQTDPVVNSTTQNNVIEQALQHWSVIGSPSSESTPVIAYIQQNNSQDDAVPSSSSILATLLKNNDTLSPNTETQLVTVDTTQQGNVEGTPTTLNTINLSQSMSPLMYSLGVVPVLSVSGQSGPSDVPTSMAAIIPDQNSSTSIQYIVQTNSDGTTAPLLVNRIPSAENESTNVSSQTEFQLLTTMSPSASRLDEASSLTTGLLSTASFGSLLTPVFVTTQSSNHLQTTDVVSNIKESSTSPKTFSQRALTVLCTNSVDDNEN